MKKVLSVVMISLLPAIFAADIADNFDSVSWGHWNAAECKAQYNKSAAGGINGTACAEIAYLPANPGNKEAYYLKKFPLEGGKQYQATVMVKNNGTGNGATASLTIQAFDAQNKFHSSVTSATRKISGDWMRLTCIFTVPANAPTIQVLLGGKGGNAGSILFDDFLLKKVEIADGIVDHFDSADAWGFWKTDEAKTSKIFVEDDGKEAKGCIGIAIAEGNPKKRGGSLLRRFPVEKGKEYTFIVQVKSIGLTNETPISLSLQGQDGKTLFLGTGVQGTSIKAEACREWKRMVFTYKIPSNGKWANCAYVLVTLSVSGDTPGKALFDDFEFFVNDEE